MYKQVLNNKTQQISFMVSLLSSFIEEIALFSEHFVDNAWA